MKNETVRRYSIGFKRQIVREYEQGSSLTALQKRYGIGGRQTIMRWIERYGIEGVRHRVMHIQHPSERDKVKALEERVAALEKALAQETLDRLMYESMVDVIEEKYGIDVKKKIGGELSFKRTGRPGKGRLA